MSKLIIGTHHIALKAPGESAFKQALHFYGELLGLKTVRRWEAPDRRGAMLASGSCLLEITDNGTLDKPVLGSIAHFALLTHSVDRCIETVREAGYEVIMEPKNAELPCDPPYKVRVAFCRGPIGEEIEFFEER